MTSTVVPPPAGQSAGGDPATLLAQAAELVDQVAQTMWAARCGAELTATVQGVVALKAKLDGVELAVARELDAGVAGPAALKEAGWASVKDYLTHTTGGRKSAGPATVRLARQLDQLEPLAEALAAGTLSRAKAQIIASSVDKLPLDPAVRRKALAVLLEDAERLSADDLEVASRHVLEVVDPDGVDAELERSLDRAERASHLNRELTLRFDRVGGGHGRFNGSKEDVLLLKTGLMALAAPQPADAGSCGGDGVCTSLECKRNGHDGRDPRDHGTRMFDALVELVRRAQAAGALPDCHGGVPQVVLTMDFDDLKDRVGEATTTCGEELDADTALRLACDADLIPGVLGADGRVLDVGRTQRLVTAAIWVALVLRDQRCAFPGCRRPPVMCHAHHIVHWVDRGGTSLENIVLLCGTHHRIVHNTPWAVRLNQSDRRPEFRPPGREDWVRERVAVDRPPDRPPDQPPDQPPEQRRCRPDG